MPAVTFKETDVEIVALMRIEVNKQLNKRLQKTVKPITLLIKTELARAVSEQPEYSSIIGGILRHEFGIPDGISRLGQIVDIWVDSVTVKVINNGALVEPMITVEIRAVPANYSDVLASPSASLTTEKGDVLEWLSWILTEGNKQDIIPDHRSIRGRGRAASGGIGLIMVKGGQWGVPSIFQGDSGNNFVIRAIQQIEPVLETNIIKIVQKAINV